MSTIKHISKRTEIYHPKLYSFRDEKFWIDQASFIPMKATDGMLAHLPIARFAKYFMQTKSLLHFYPTSAYLKGKTPEENAAIKNNIKMYLIVCLLRLINELKNNPKHNTSKDFYVYTSKTFFQYLLQLGFEEFKGQTVINIPVEENPKLGVAQINRNELIALQNSLTEKLRMYHQRALDYQKSITTETEN